MSDAIVIPQANTQDIASIKNQSNFTRLLRLADPSSPMVKESKMDSLRFYLGHQDEDKIIYVGVLDTDTDGIKKGMMTAVPLAIRPHAMYIVDNKIDMESYVPNDAVWQDIAAKKKAKITGSNVGLDILYHIQPDQLDFNSVTDPKANKDFKESMKNGVLAIFYYKNSSAKYCPDYALPKNNKFTRLRIKARLAKWDKYIWSSPTEHIILQENLDAAQAFINPMDIGPEVQATVMNFSSARSASIIDAPALPR